MGLFAPARLEPIDKQSQILLQHGVPAFVVAHRRVLETVAREKPATEGASLEIKGIGWGDCYVTQANAINALLKARRDNLQPCFGACKYPSHPSSVGSR